MEEEYVKKEQDLRGRLRDQMDKLIQEQTDQINSMQGEFHNASSLMDKKFRSLNEKF